MKEATMKRFSLFAGLTLIASLTGVDAAQRHNGRSPLPHYAYRADGADAHTVSQFRVLPDGRRLPLNPPTVAVLGTAYTLTIDPTRRFVYVPDGDYAYVAQFRIGPGGRLRPLSPPTVQVNSHPSAVVCHPNGRFVYVPCSHGGIYQFHRRRDGTLAPLKPAVVWIPGDAVRDPAIVALRDSGRQAIVTTDEGYGTGGEFQSCYRVATDGTLHLLQKRRVKSGPFSSQMGVLRYAPPRNWSLRRDA
jgi:hypothetical protein